MILPTRRVPICAAFSVFAVLAPMAAQAQSAPAAYANFEASQTNPIRLSADGKFLFAVNTANSSLSVFDVSQPSNPNLLAQIPVGLGPVSVNPRSDTEAWVVNQVSNSISVVTAPNGLWTNGLVTGTIYLNLPQADGSSAGEPMDVVFAGSAAYASISRAHQVEVIDQKTQALLSTIQLFGDSPRAMAVSPDGKTVYVAFALAGNASTLIPYNSSPTPCGTAAQGRTPCVPAMNPNLPPAPPASLIVSATDPAWYPTFIKYTMPDHGVAAIATGTHRVSYYSGVGTINLGLAVNPVGGDLFVANTDALNVTMFESNLCGHWVNNRITHIQVSNSTVTPVDLNPTIAYGCAPNTTDLGTALAQPAGVVFDPGGSFMYVAAFGTDRVAKVNTSGQVMGFVEVSPPSGSGSNVDPANKRGPRGLALNSTAGILYCLNRISNTISVIPASLQNVTTEIPVGTDPTPAAVKAGRGFLYDAKLSGTGTGACASCHIDGEMDHLAWNLGDPTGEMTSFVQNGQTFLYHPMKGPMTTQTLRGMADTTPFHWRGDKPDFAAFNGAFAALMGGTPLSDSDMASFTTFINSVLYLPNPSETLDRNMPATVNGGDPTAGLADYLSLPLNGQDGQTCQSCHTAAPGPGSNLAIQPANHTHAQQPLKVPQLRALYQKQLYNRANGAPTIDGFGMEHDGSVDGVTTFLKNPTFAGYTATERTDIGAYLLCFDTGTAPAVGYTRTLTATNVTTSPVQGDWTTLQLQAAAGNIDLIGRGTLGGVLHGLLYQPASGKYISDVGVLYTQSALQTLILAGDTLSIMGVYPGTGSAQ